MKPPVPPSRHHNYILRYANSLREFPCAPHQVQSSCFPRKRKGHPATGRPSLQGRIVPTEAIDSVKTFCRNLMSPKTRVSSDFWEINAFIFNNLQKVLTASVPAQNQRKIAAKSRNPIFLRYLHRPEQALTSFRGVAGRLRSALHRGFRQVQRNELHLL